MRRLGAVVVIRDPPKEGVTELDLEVEKRETTASEGTAGPRRTRPGHPPAKRGLWPLRLLRV